METKWQEIEHAAEQINVRFLYKNARDLTESVSNTSISIKNKAGEIFVSEEEKNDRWVEYFSEILNQPISTILLDLDDDINNVTDNADMSMNNISKGKIEEELKALANNKAVDLYFILPELLK